MGIKVFCPYCHDPDLNPDYGCEECDWTGLVEVEEKE
jgi:hypothetical protein